LSSRGHGAWRLYPPTVCCGVGIHTAAIVLTTAAVAAIVYEWLGLGLLRRAWINVDLLWTGALAATGLVLLLV
jgi:hypothetical protein